MGNYTLLKQGEGKARRGELVTPHGTVQTPVFMNVGTQGAIKGALSARDLKEIDCQVELSNTYHLHVRPGDTLIKELGGLHKFMTWDGPILTDSGGFQVFSLAPIRKLTEEGCRFASHIDGSRHTFTPENNVDTQRIIGADIIMALDECCPGDADYRYAAKSLRLTQGWLERFAAHFDETEPLYGYDQTMFPIIQGCVYPDLRKQALEHALGLDNANRGGYAVGGLAVGEPTEKMYEMLEVTCPLLPEGKPRYLMGVGTPANILEGIARGIDMFDCVMPTRNGRNGMLFTWNGIMNMRNAKWTDDFTALDPEGTSFVDHYYTRAYLHHLFVAKEMFAAMVATEHNLAFYLDLVRTARRHIEAGDFAAWKDVTVNKLMQRL